MQGTQLSKRVLRIVLGDRVVAYHPYLARVMGSASGGVWLSQILYWDSVKAVSADDDAENWFYKTDAEIIGETCLTKRETQESKIRARELGIIKTELRGMPAKTHYLVDIDALGNAIERACLHNAGQQVGTTPVNKLVQTHAQNLPQSTTESTTEIPPLAETKLPIRLDGEVTFDSLKPALTEEERQAMDKRIASRTLENNGAGVGSPQAAREEFLDKVARKIERLCGLAEDAPTARQVAAKIYKSKTAQRANGKMDKAFEELAKTWRAGDDPFYIPHKILAILDRKTERSKIVMG